MNDNWTAAGLWFLQTAVGGGLVLLLTCLVMRFTRQPARRQRLGECGLLAALLVALGSAIGPSWLVIAWRSAPGQTDRRVLAEHLLPAMPENIHDAVLIDEPARDTRVISDLTDVYIPTPADPQTPSSVAESWTSQLLKGVMISMSVVAGFFAIRLLVGYVGLFRLMRRAESPPEEVRSLFEAMADGTRWLRLLVSRRILAPLSCGLWRPTVMLPSAMCTKPAQRQLRWIFIHELTHLRRRDAWSSLLLNIGQILFFALPWFWWLRRQVRLCQEYIADAAVTQGNENVEYAEFLLNLAGAPAVPVGASAIAGKTSDLYRRVTMLLNDSIRVEGTCPRRWTMLAAGTLTMLGLFLSGVAYRAEASPDKQVVIVVRPQSGQTGTQPIVQIIVLPGDRKGTEKKGDSIKGPDVLRYVPVEELRFVEVDELKFVERIHGWGTRLDKAVEVLPADSRLRVGEPLFIIEKTSEKGGTGWFVQAGDDMTPLRNAIKRLDELKAQGKLTKEAIQAEVTKALQEMKVAKVNFLSIEIATGGVDDGKFVLSLDELHKKFADRLWIADKIQVDTKNSIRLWSVEPQLHIQDAQLQLWSEKPQVQLKKTIPLARKRYKLALSEPLPGMSLEAIRPAYAEQLQLPMDVGLLVKSVSNGSSGEKAGIKADDILVKIAGGMVPGNLNEFYKFVNSLKTGVPLEVVVLRKGKMETAGSITLSESTSRWIPSITDTKKRVYSPKLIDDYRVIDKGKLEFSPLPTSDLPLAKTIDLIPSKSKDDATGDPGKVE